MRNPLRRYYGRGDLHFITCSCYRRLPFLGTARARNRFVKVLDEVRTRHKFSLIGYVVMPEHIHLLISEPRIGNPSKSLQVLKQRASRALRKKRRPNLVGQLRLMFASPGEVAPAFWQRRFYDFNVWSSKKLQEKLNYMHRNPVQRQLVIHPKDWPWSSWSHYARAEQGLIHIDSLDNGSSDTPLLRRNVKNRTLENHKGCGTQSYSCALIFGRVVFAKFSSPPALPVLKDELSRLTPERITGAQTEVCATGARGGSDS